MTERVAIFIDGSNLYHSLENNFRRHDLNYTEFIAKLCRNRPMYRAYYYNVLQDPTKRQDAPKVQSDFLDVLHRTPYLEIRLGGTKLSQGVSVEKGIDIMLATDLLYFAWRDFYDIAILVSGDSDFTYALQTVKNMGKYVEVAYFENAVSRDVLDTADYRYLMDRSFFTGLWAGKRRSKRKRSRPKGELSAVPQQQTESQSE